MTKYVLNSGGISHSPALKRKFHLELVKDLSDSPKFLLCNFAQAREYWETKFPKYSESIREDMTGNISPTFELAMPDTFVGQCKNADIIYFHGGDDHLLQYWIKQFKPEEIFKDKVVATNSASSNMLSTNYWTCDWRQCSDGLAVLPIKFMPHFSSDFGDTDPRGPIDWQRAYEELRAYGDASLPIHALKEGEFIIINK